MLANAIRLAALVPLSAGLAGALLGPGFAGDAASAESHGRYLSGLLFGLGLVAAWCAGDLRRRGGVFEALCCVVVAGGLARLLGLALAEPPPWPHRLALLLELGAVPALALWRRRVFKRDA